ncbi:Ig-like domain-containing protein [Marinobacter sp. S0848L]|uniref:Ig-like domain-containing protein n=1 Tax=Marinobacter sp. S0848L TaxID=2926423 RepID=UPI001FF58430|nr:Ig-like domain-containing protein [Marinobacter sp. S0848L]MCK0106972.1 Ig-like domain-containing protein [Marinobacter sp. S0848L]
MKQFKTLALIPAMLLAACGGSDEQNIKQSVKDRNQSVSLVYSYPMDGQADVSPKADIVLRFSHAIGDDEATLAQKIQVQSSAGSPAFAVTKIDGGKSLKLEMSEGQTLTSRETYSITFNEPLLTEGGREIDTPNAVGEPGIQFDTRGEFSGVAELAETSDEFGVAWQVPANGTAFEAANFSTFRLALTHPVHPEWQKLGGSIELLDKNGTAVPATVLVKGNRVTVDPCVTEDPKACGSKDDILNAGQEYTLKLNNLASLTSGPDGARLSKSFNFTPRATGPTVLLEQQAVDSNGGNLASVLNGQAINGVVLNSVLQGVTDTSQQTGSLFAELAYAPSFKADEALPLRIPKGSVLESTSLNIKVGGKVQALDAKDGSNQETGTIKVTMLSDASGYMAPNPYTDDINAPRHITLFMDVSMNTEEAMPNAALSQDLMGVELRGIALVKDGVLTIDAIGMVEPNLLGQEFTDSTIAFHLQAATDVDSVLDAEVLREIDNTAPKLVSWMPGDKDNAIPNTRQSIQRPGDPVILFFDEPLDPASIAGGVKLYADGQELTLNTALDGTALTLNPEGGLKAGIQYKVSAPGLTDLAGNLYDSMANDLSFSLDGQRDVASDAPPIALTTYPGFPCETNHAKLDLENNVLGECYTRGADSTEADKDTTTGGDILPVSEMPADRPIMVVFSQPMNLDSIKLGDTFIVRKVNPDGSRIDGSEGEVTGRLEKNSQRIRFYPDKAWEKDAFYQYTLVSKRGSDEVTNAAYSRYCNEPDPTSVCGINNYPLKTDLLEGLNSGGGAGSEPIQSMKIYFKGVEPQSSVFTALRNLPIRDVNANFKIDGENEPFAHEPNGSGGYLPSANAAKLLTNYGNEKQEARVGCAVDDTDTDKCERNKFIYQTYALNTEVIGSTVIEEGPDKGKDALKVLLYPTTIVTSSLDVHLELFSIVSTTGPQVLRMRYAQDPECVASGAECRRDQLIPGYIIEGDKGQPVFKTKVDVFLDAPDLRLKSILTAEHNLFNYEFTLDLVGDVNFFDDGRMQIEQYNLNIPEIMVKSEVLSGLVKKEIPLIIPERGLYLNFISNPVKDLPREYGQQQAAPQ